MQQRCYGPVTQGLEMYYIFDHQTCSCLLCDPKRFNTTTDRRGCTCRYSNVADVLAARDAANNPFPTPNAYLTAPYELANKCSQPNAYFDATSCDCKICPLPDIVNADKTACNFTNLSFG